jgi:hypothetical protein
VKGIGRAGWSPANLVFSALGIGPVYPIEKRVVANHWRLHMEVFEFRVFGITAKIETPNMRVVFWVLKSLAASGEAIQVLRDGHWIDLEIAKVETKPKKKRAA